MVLLKEILYSALYVSIQYPDLIKHKYLKEPYSDRDTSVDIGTSKERPGMKK